METVDKESSVEQILDLLEATNSDANADIIIHGDDNIEESTQEHRADDEVCHAEDTIGEDEHNKTLINKTLSDNLDELNHRKMNVVKQSDQLRERINGEGADSAVQKLISFMTSLKDLERQENHFLSDRDSKHSELQDEISELERKITYDCDSESLTDGLHHSFSESLERVDLMKKQLAARLRDTVAVRRRIDDLPCQSEILQYERRLSELYAQIQGKHRQTRRYYATYNALLEIKELMLKETSLLNSIISQFQEAFSSTDGRVKLVHSMEGIVKGSQQKLEKVQLGLREEERIRNDLKDRYTAAIGQQKRCYSLFKAFQSRALNLRGLELCLPHLLPPQPSASLFLEGVTSTFHKALSERWCCICCYLYGQRLRQWTTLEN